MRASSLFLLELADVVFYLITPPSVFGQQQGGGQATSVRRRIILSADGSHSIELLLERHICNNGIGQLYRMHSFTSPIFSNCADWCLRHGNCNAFDYEARRKSWYCWFYKSTTDCRPQPFIYSEVYVKRQLIGGGPSVPSVGPFPASPPISTTRVNDEEQFAETPEPVTVFKNNNDGSEESLIQLPTPIPVTPQPPPPPPTTSATTEAPHPFDALNPAGSEEVVGGQLDSEVMVIPLIVEDVTTSSSHSAVVASPGSGLRGKTLPEGRSISSMPPQQQSNNGESAKEPATPMPYYSKHPLLQESAIPTIVLSAEYFSTTTGSNNGEITQPYEMQYGDSATLEPSTPRRGNGDSQNEQYGAKNVASYGGGDVKLPRSPSDGCSVHCQHRYYYYQLLTAILVTILLTIRS